MPTTPDGAALFLASGVLYGPGKAANAGGVAVSCLEMTQDSAHLQWSREQVDERLRAIMKSIHTRVSAAAAEYGQPGNYVLGANIAGFLRVATAMLAEDVV
jgi:glutamate dehydrogenase (NADP+)